MATRNGVTQENDGIPDQTRPRQTEKDRLGPHRTFPEIGNGLLLLLLVDGAPP
jgi:hypothetical protein